MEHQGKKRASQYFQEGQGAGRMVAKTHQGEGQESTDND